VRLREHLRGVWRYVRDEKSANAVDAGRTTAARKTLTLPLSTSMYVSSGQSVPKITPANLRRMAEVPVVRRAINIIKDRIAAMDWQVRLKRPYPSNEHDEAKLRAIYRVLDEPNENDSLRSLLEQVIEDTLTGGFGAVEMEATGDEERPAKLWAVDGATIRINPKWDGQVDSYHYAQVVPGISEGSAVQLRDDELMYIRCNPRSYTSFGLGPLEVAFETINHFLGANRYAGKLAANAVAQYALWINEATPAQHDRLIRWWQDEIEGTGRVPLLSTEQKPEVLRFAQGTDADLRIVWQEFLIRMIADAFGLPPMLLGLEGDVNKATAAELVEDAFRGAISPMADLIASHITRDLLGKCIGWSEYEFIFNELSAKDESTELNAQIQLLQAGILTVDEVRAMRGLSALSKATRLHAGMDDLED